ncbi:MAG: nucleotide sugar dehydrogenase [bacterium]|nr:nucleotide sugar dehydrogenase [bacterium]
MQEDYEKALSEKIAKKGAKIGVIGLGYVGLPLAVEFAKSGFAVLGFDIDKEKVSKLNDGISYIPDIETADVQKLSKKNLLSATNDFSKLKEQDVIFICVPTPFTKAKAPDISYIISASEQIKANIRKGQLIILQSTTYPGTTEEVVLPMLKETGLKEEEEFLLAFSPERIDPGNKTYTIKNTPKVVGGLSEKSTRLSASLFSYITPNVFQVSSPKAAELCKLLENTFRSVNIALVNELALLCNRMGINVWEVIEAASTKPFGFMPFWPGPGVGGHCIPVDPYYLSWKAREYDFSTKFIELAAETNLLMPRYVVSIITDSLNKQKKTVNGSKILLLGVAFKKDIDDPRNSPSEAIIEMLIDSGADFSYNDPYISSVAVKGRVFESTPLTKESLSSSDCVVIAVDHSAYDIKKIVEHSQLIVDTRGVTRKIISKKVVLL